MERSSFSKYSRIIVGVIVFLLGIFSTTKPGQVVSTITIVAGIAILFQGVFELYSFFKIKDILVSSKLLLFGAIIDIVFGIFILSNILVASIAMSLLVCVWFLFASILRVVRATELKQAGAKNWWVVMLVGIISTVFAFTILWNPIAGGIIITYAVAFALMSGGVMLVVEAFGQEKEKK